MKNKYNEVLRKRIEAMNKLNVERLDVNSEESNPEKTSPKPIDVWVREMAEELKAMGLPYTVMQIFGMLTESILWAKTHPSINEDVIYIPKRRKMVAPIATIKEKRRSNWMRLID